MPLFGSSFLLLRVVLARCGKNSEARSLEEKIKVYFHGSDVDR